MRALFIQEFILKFYNTNFPIEKLIVDANAAWDAISDQKGIERKDSE